MAHALAEDLFVGFDVSDREKMFLLDVLCAPGTPLVEKLIMYDLCMFSGYEDWYMQLECAASVKERRPAGDDLDSRDVLSFVPRVNLAEEKLRKGWAATDQSIKNLAVLLRVHRTDEPVESVPKQQQQQRIVKREGLIKRERDDDAVEALRPGQRVKRQKTSTSHYFAPPSDEETSRDRSLQQSPTPVVASSAPTGSSSIIRDGIATPRTTPHTQASSGRNAVLAQPHQHSVSDELIRIIVPRGLEPRQVRTIVAQDASSKPKAAIKSPFFNQPQTRHSLKSKRTCGLISTIPFPPLSAPRFGLIQEEFGHEPFWLLVVVTFLVKTAGTLAIPTFYKVKERFPSPAALADPNSTIIIRGMIHHLGLSVVRTATIQRYARMWMEKPPVAGITYRVRNYDKREVQPAAPRSAHADQDSIEVTAVYSGDAEDAWEMGHLTQGKYALDSWRIFCRDEVLGRAQDWNGKGAAPNFQPEWMRVRPDDKELRACLRWMWMREGWEWDPVTGEKTVLRREMQRAVNERRVDYDDFGGLKILDEPRLGST